MMMTLFETPFFKPSKIIESYYPIFKDIQNYKYDKNKINLLVLGGSVVYNDTIHVGKEAKSFLNMPTVTYDAHFCAINKLIPEAEFNVLSLAMSGHNSLDSWYKYKYCKRNNIKFDYVLPYHGINDLRTNNIWRKNFNINYRHVEFYDELYIINRHPEINFFTAPFMIDWLILGLKKEKQGPSRYISKDVFMGLLTGNPEEHVKQGGDIKTNVSFRRNYNKIIRLAKRKHETVVLATYASNQPDDYDFEKFYRKELPYYDEQLFPTELYGMPEHIKKGLELHNSIIRSLANENPKLPFIDVDFNIPNTKEYFNDACHLTDKGCRQLAHLIYQKLRNKNN
jgi:hypothetical protein